MADVDVDKAMAFLRKPKVASGFRVNLMVVRCLEGPVALSSGKP